MAAGSVANGTNGANGSSKRDGSSPVGDGGPTTSIHVAHTHVLEWHVASYTVAGRRAAGPGFLSGLRRERKMLLQGLAGRTQSGELTAVMGPSGSGKTTLLECISLRNRSFDGAVHYDGRPCDGSFFTASAFVHQKELLYGYLTPREHLTFHAFTRMSREYSREALLARVEEVIREVKLEKCADTIVGGHDPVFMRKGISGGERKRLDLAAELLLAPDIIFLDEPSSGLDSVMAESIFSTLHDLATKEGRLVMASAHCPSSTTFNLFTHLLLLTADGRLAYHGPCANDEALAFFTGPGLEFPLPKKHFNPADFYLSLVSAAPGADPEEEARRMDLLSAAFQASGMRLAEPLPVDNRHKSFQQVRGFKASAWTLLKLNLWRSSLQISRDVFMLFLWGFVSTGIGGLFGVLYWQQAADNWRNLMGLMFSVVVACIFTATLGVVMRFPLEWTIVLREYFSAANAIGPYMCARFLCNLPLGYGPFLLATVIYWMTGMLPDVRAYLEFSVIFISYNFACFSLGQFVSSLSTNPLISMTLLPAFTTPMVMFCGILYERSSVPRWLGWIEKISLVNYANNALLSQQLQILPKQQADALAGFIGLNKAAIWKDVGWLWLMNVVLQLLTYVSLSVRAGTAKAVV